MTQLQIAALTELATRAHNRVDTLERDTSHMRVNRVRTVRPANGVNDDRATIACLAAKKDKQDERLNTMSQNYDTLINILNNALTRIDSLDKAICPRVAARLTALERHAMRDSDVKFEERLDRLERHQATTNESLVREVINRQSGIARLMADIKADIKADHPVDLTLDAGWEPEGIKADRSTVRYHQILNGARKLKGCEQRELINTLVIDWLG